MTTSARLNNLILNESWTRIYQTFKSADFKSYDFENLRRVIIAYFRENYPEDFNDYIESSEYLALIDAIAFLGQSLAFRIDLASRENFIELAERKESVLRLAKMLSYNAKRNIAAKGLLKFDTVSTTESVLDSNGKNLSQQTIIWNDPTNQNWSEQFVAVLNAAMADNTEFGRSQGSATIEGIQTEQYRFRTASSDVPIFTFSKIVAGRQMTFELVSTTFKGKEEVYEESPFPGNQLGFLYRNDGRGGTSSNTGFFLMFRQGSLELADFSISVPSTNEIITIDSDNINDDDVWLFSLNSGGAQLQEWTKVSSLIGNNIAYNSITSDIRNIYSVLTKENDRVDLVFADGVYGNLPQGAFRVFYRKSNGLVYQIAPSEMRGITISIPYINKQGVGHTLTITLGLKYTVSSSAAAESVDSIRRNAPAQYYTQNRMVTGEDYNLAPLSASQDILKINAVNRTSSGISRNFEIIDASGKYSSVNVFADDGYMYKEEVENSIAFKYTNRIEILNFIRNKIEPAINDVDIYNFYLTKFDKINFTDINTLWQNLTSDVNLSTGYFKSAIDFNIVLKVGTYTSSTLKYVAPGALIKFVPPEGKNFKRGNLVDIDIDDPEQKSSIWVKVIKISGDGTNAGRGALASGLGAIQFNDVVPTGAIAARIVPKFTTNLSTALETEMTNQMFTNLNFGLRYNPIDGEWKLITASNLNLLSNFTLGKAGDVSNSNLDSSWVLAFIKEADEYVVRIRSLEYIFGSLEQNRFYYDFKSKSYDSKTGKVIKDMINVLSINSDSNLLYSLKQDIKFEISDTIRYEDGYQSVDRIKIAFYDNDSDGVIDNPESFEQIVGNDQILTPLDKKKFIFFQEVNDSAGNKIKQYIDNSNNVFDIQSKESLINVNDYANGQLIYFYDSNEDQVKRVDRNTNTLILESTYTANIGRAKLKFQYVHSASVDRRIDPSASNIIDVYILTRSYDTAFRNYLAGAAIKKPEAPNSDSLRISFGSKLNLIKTISDEIIYHPVEYKVLFGSTADIKLQAKFKVVKNANKLINDNDLKVRIISAINEFFDVNNWDFGDRFFISEMITYVINTVSPDISNMVIVPRQTTQSFGSLFEIQSAVDEIFVSGARVDDIEIVSAISATEIRAVANTIVTSTE
jgi:hypothetical protein